MRDSHYTEILFLCLAGIGAILIYVWTWVSFILGVAIILLNSYFVSSKLKEQTIREYLALKQNSEKEKSE